MTDDITSTHDPEQSGRKRDSKYDAVLIQLSSQRPSDIFRGMEQVRQWLKENAENQDVYGMLLDAVQANRELLRDKVRNLLTEMMEQGKSKSAEQALFNLPGGIQDLLADADDEYYAAEYENAIRLYRRVLKLDPKNMRARDHLAKAEIKLVAGESASGLPRSAEQYYRRARSYLAAGNIVTAKNLLDAALEAAEAKGVPYPAADQALRDIQNLITAEELRQGANQALNQDNWKDALSKYEGALKLNPGNEQIKKELDSLQNLLFAETELQGSKLLKVFSPLAKWQNAVNNARLFIYPNNSQLKFVEDQIQGIRRIRFTLLSLLILYALAGYFMAGISRNFFGISSTTETSTTSPPTPTDTLVVTIDTTETLEITPLAVTPTESPTLTPTQAYLGTGYIIKAFVSSWDVPNEKFVESLGLYQPVTILEKQEVAGSTWYRCSWTNKEGQPREGWILGEYITIGIPPTPRS